MANTDINRNPEDLADFVRERLELSLSECEENGYPVRLFEGKRTNERQAWLWTQGRTRSGKIITNAGPWRSAHVYGLGVDICFYINNAWSWEGEYDKVANVFQRNGFRWLYPFEKCHFEILNGYSMRECEAITKSHGIEYLWEQMREKFSKNSIR